MGETEKNILRRNTFLNENTTRHCVCTIISEGISCNSILPPATLRPRPSATPPSTPLVAAVPSALLLLRHVSPAIFEFDEVIWEVAYVLSKER